MAKGPTLVQPPSLSAWPTTHHLSSANLSTQVLKLAKLSLFTLVWLPTTKSFHSWPTTHYPQFCQFKHLCARIGKIEPVLALIFASLSAQVLELAKMSLLCLLDCPPPSFLPIEPILALAWLLTLAHPLSLVLWIPILVCLNSQNCKSDFK